MPPLYFCMGLDFTLRNNLSKPLWRGIPLLTLSLIVRFLHVIGQPPMPTDSACPILPHYRTTSKTISLRLSDSSTLSDNQQCQLTPLVRFFYIIGQPARQSHSACPISPLYRTTTTDQAYFNAISSTNLVTSLKASQQSSRDLYILLRMTVLTASTSF